MKERDRGQEKEQFADERDEIAFLRQKFSSLSIRGHYKECFKLIEEKMKLLYFKERWPENFLSSLLLHKRCYPSMDIQKPYEEYLAGVLQKNNIPAIFAKLLKGGGKDVIWKASWFQEQALGCRREGNFQDALGYAQLMAKVDTLSSSAQVLVGWILSDLGRHKEATEAYERALELNKNNFQASMGLAEAYAATDPQKALSYLKTALEATPEQAELVAAQGRILAKAGDLERAYLAFDKAAGLEPLNPEWLFQKAELYDREGQTIAAVRQYNRVLQLESGHLPTLERLAVLTAESQPEQALRYAITVCSAKPEDLPMALHKARLQEATGDIPGAIRQYSLILKSNDSVTEACGALGRLLLHESPERALAWYEKACEQQPDAAAWHIGKARCHQKLQNSDAAAQAYQEAVTRDKNSAEAWAALAAFRMERDPKGALAHVNRALALAPEQAAYHRLKGELLQKLSAGPQDILACYNTAVRYDPGNGELHLALARLLEDIGNLASATEHYRAAVNIDPGLEDAHHGLVRLLLYSDPEAALTHVNKALALADRAEYCYLKSRVYSVLGSHPEVVHKLRETLADDPDAMQELAQLLDGNTPRVAMMYINRALELAPENPRYLCARAGLLGELGDAKNALAQYQKALDQDENCHEAHFGMGKLLAAQDSAAALGHLDKAEAFDPTNARYTAEKALCIARDPGRYLEALDCMDAAIAKDKRMWDILLAKAKLLDEHDETLPAIDHYRRVLLLFPDCLEANERMGILLAEYNPAAALQYTDKAAQLNPLNYTCQVWRGRLLHTLEDAKAAQSAVRKAILLGGETEAVYYTLAQMLQTVQPQTALRYCNKAMELSPGDAAYPLLRGNILRRMDALEEAVASFERALELDSRCHEALARLAELAYKQGNPESLSFIERALEINGGNASYHYLRGLILEGQGAFSQAAACLDEAVRLAPGNLTYREKLVELLGKARSPLQRFVQKRKLDRLRRRFAQLEQSARQLADQQ